MTIYYGSKEIKELYFGSQKIESLSIGNIDIPVVSTVTFTLVPDPADATVVLTAEGYAQEGNSISVAPGTTITYTVSKEGYTTQTGTQVCTINCSFNCTLETATVTLWLCTPWSGEWLSMTDEDGNTQELIYDDDKQVYLINNVPLVKTLTFEGSAFESDPDYYVGIHEISPVIFDSEGSYTIGEPLTNANITSTWDSTAGTFTTVIGNDVLTPEYSTWYAELFGILCLSADTMIMMANGSEKALRDITLDDEVLAWDFDEGKLTTTNVLWTQNIKTIDRYYKVTTSSGKEIKCVGPKYTHRLFSVEQGMFQYPQLMINDTIWTIDGFEKIVSGEWVEEEIEYGNAISFRHINLITNGILTSCSYNNIYPIENMKFVKNEIINIERNALMLPDFIKEGMRLSEQPFANEDILQYISKMQSFGEFSNK